MTVRLDVIGPPRLSVADEARPLRPRALDVLAALAVNPTSVTPTDVLAELIWTEVPLTAHAVIQNQVAYVRSQIGPSTIVTERDGYRLGTDVRRDITRFERMVGNAERARRLRDVPTARDEAQHALALARGGAFERLPATIAIVRARQRVVGLTLAAEETLAASLVALGDHERAAAMAERMIADGPQREYRWALAAIALYRSQRRREALATMTTAVRRLGEAGLEPGPALKRLESLLLADDPRLLDADIVDELLPRSNRDDVTEPTRRTHRSLRHTVLQAVDREHVAGRTAVVTITADRPPQARGVAESIARGAAHFGWQAHSIRGRREHEHPAHPLDLVASLGRFDDASGAPNLVVVDHADERGPDADRAISSIVRDGGPSIVMVGANHPDAIHIRPEDANWHQPPGMSAKLANDLEGIPDVALRFALLIALGRGGVPLDAADHLPGRRHLALLAERQLIDVAADRLEVWSDQLVDELIARSTPAELAVAHRDLADAHRHAAIEPAEEAHHRVVAAAISGVGVDAALEALARAADHHEQRGDLHLTTELLMRSAVLTADPAVALAHRVRAGECLRRAGDPRCEEVQRDAARAGLDLGRFDLAADALISLAVLGPTTEVGSVDPGLADEVDDVLNGDLDVDRTARLAGAATLLHSLAGDHERTVAYFRRAEAALSSTTEATRGLVLPYGYMALVGPGAIDDRRRIAHRLLGLGERLDDDEVRLEALHFLFSNQLQLGDPGVYATQLAYETIADRSRDHQRTWVAGYLRATLEHMAGRIEEAEATALSGLEEQGVAASRTMAIYSVQLMAIRLTQGRLAELADPIDELVAEQPAVAGWRACAALVAAEVGDLERAGEELDRVRKLGGLPRDATWSATGFVAGCAAAVAADRQAATWLLPQMEPMTGLMSWPGSCTLGPCDAPLGALFSLLGDDERAALHRQQARDITAALAAPVFDPLLGRLEQIG